MIALDLAQFTGHTPGPQIERLLTNLHTTANRVGELFSAQYMRAHDDAGRVAHAMKQMNAALSEASIHAPQLLAELRASQAREAELATALADFQSTALNLHCALQSTAGMDPNDHRISSITGGVVKDLRFLEEMARALLAKKGGAA